MPSWTLVLGIGADSPASAASPCSPAGKITGPLPWEDAAEAGSPHSVRSPAVSQLQPQADSGAWDQQEGAAMPPRQNGAADSQAGPPAPDAGACLAVQRPPLHFSGDAHSRGRLSCFQQGRSHSFCQKLAEAQSCSAILMSAPNCLSTELADSPPRSSSSGSVPDYVGNDLGRALSTPERMRPDSAWCA